MIGALVAEVARTANVMGDLSGEPIWMPTGVTAGQVGEILRHKYKPETVRRYMNDLKRYGLLEQFGRGEHGLVSYLKATVDAYVATVRNWTERLEKGSPGGLGVQSRRRDLLDRCGEGKEIPGAAAPRLVGRVPPRSACQREGGSSRRTVR